MSFDGQWWPIRDLLGLGPIPRSQSKAIAWVRRNALRWRWGTGNGGERLEVLIADLPEDVRAALEQRRAGLPAIAAAIEERRVAYRQSKAPARQRAQQRAAAVLELEHLVAGGAGRLEAQAQVSATHGVSPRTLRRLQAKSRGVTRGPDLAPALADNYKPSATPEPAWVKPLLKLYRMPQKRSLQDVLDQLRNELGAAGPSRRQAARYVAGLSSVERARGRLGPNALKAVRPYVRRTVDGLAPGDCCIADGHTFDAEVMHPSGGQPCRPELTCVLDVRTRKWVGWSATLAESTWAVADALRHAVETHGVPAIYYADRGPGQQSAVVEQMLARLGIQRERSIARNSQARGLIEAFNKNLIKAAKRLPTFMGAGMDGDAQRLVHLRTRRELRLVGTSSLLMRWADFLRFVEAEQASYNARPHRSLDGLSPAEAWERMVAEHDAPIRLDQAELDDLARPYEVRTTRRGVVRINNGAYFARQPEHHDGAEVLVGYDLSDPSKVWVKDLHERLLAVAGLDANAAPYFPASRIEQAREQRARGRLRRLQAQADSVHAELPGQRAAPAALDQAAEIVPPTTAVKPSESAYYLKIGRLFERDITGDEPLSDAERARLDHGLKTLLSREVRRYERATEKRRASRQAAEPGWTTEDDEHHQNLVEAASRPRLAAVSPPYEVVELSGTEDDAFFARARWLERRRAAGEELAPDEVRWLEVAQGESWYASLSEMQSWREKFWAKAG